MKTLIFLIGMLYFTTSVGCQSKFFNLESYIINTLKQITDQNLLKLEEKCNSQMSIWLIALETRVFWARDVADSFGRRPSGFYHGNVVWPGEYSQCLDIQKPEWNSKYCYVNEKIKWTNVLIKNETLRFKYGMCFPTKCNDEDLSKIFQYALRKLDQNVLPFDSSYLHNSTVHCRVKSNIDAYSIVAMVVTGIIGILVIIGTALDVGQRVNGNKEDELTRTEAFELSKTEEVENSPKKTTKFKTNNLVKFFSTFSAYTNTLMILKVDERRKFSCLNPLRFLAFLWVIVLHQWNHFTEIDDILIDNKFEYYDWKKSFFFTFISNGYFCVDVFFLISGFLCSYSFLRHVAGKKITGYTILRFYLRRYYRITVTLILVMLFIVGFNRFFHSGPFRSGFYELSENKCPVYFWTNLLHVNNFINSQCFPHSWYLATDIQYYLISPLILIPLSFKNKFRFIGFFLIAALVLTHVVTSAIYSWGFLAKGLKYNNIMGLYYNMEFRPWYRVASFAMGMLLGKMVIDLPNQKFIFLKKNKIHNAILVIFLWIISLLMMAITIFAQYNTFSDYNPMDRVSQTIYVSLCRITFALGLAGVIFLCVTKNGYFIDNFLSWSFWVPLAKLSFCGYLVHYSVVDTFIYAQEHFIHMQPSLYLYVFCGNVFLTICLAYIAMLLFESPFTNLEKFFFK